VTFVARLAARLFMRAFYGAPAPRPRACAYRNLFSRPITVDGLCRRSRVVAREQVAACCDEELVGPLHHPRWEDAYRLMNCPVGAGVGTIAAHLEGEGSSRRPAWSLMALRKGGGAVVLETSWRARAMGRGLVLCHGRAMQRQQCRGRRATPGARRWLAFLMRVMVMQVSPEGSIFKNGTSGVRGRPGRWPWRSAVSSSGAAKMAWPGKPRPPRRSASPRAAWGASCAVTTMTGRAVAPWARSSDKQFPVPDICRQLEIADDAGGPFDGPVGQQCLCGWIGARLQSRPRRGGARSACRMLSSSSTTSTLRPLEKGGHRGSPGGIRDVSCCPVFLGGVANKRGSWLASLMWRRPLISSCHDHWRAGRCSGNRVEGQGGCPKGKRQCGCPSGAIAISLRPDGRIGAAQRTMREESPFGLAEESPCRQSVVHWQRCTVASR